MTDPTAFLAEKRALLELVIASVEQEHRTLLAAATATQQAATHEEARPENDKDTRALEASYLARGQAMRVESLGEALVRLRFVALRPFDDDQAVNLSALVRVAVDGAPAPWTAFLLPEGGGTTVVFEQTEYRVLTPRAPLGRALLGKYAGDEFELRVAGQLRNYELLELR